MGVELVKVVVARHGDLPGGPYKVLVTMALHALDRPKDDRPARLYFAGWEPLALALGHDVPTRDDTDADVKRRRDRLQEYVRVATKPLVDRGLIERMIEQARTGTRQVWRLTIGLPSAPAKSGGSSPRQVEGLSPGETQGQEPPESRGLSPLKFEGPKKDRGGTQDLPQDRPLTVSDHLTPRASCGHRTTRDGDCIAGCGRATA